MYTRLALFSSRLAARSSLNLLNQKHSRQTLFAPRRFLSAELNQLIVAVREENVEEIGRLAKIAPNTITQQTEGEIENTAFHEAAKNGNVKMIQELKKNFPAYFDKNSGNKFVPEIICHCFKHRSSLHYSVEGGHHETTEEILKMGTNPNMLDECKRTPMDYAIERKDDKMICLLAKYGGKANRLGVESEDIIARAHAKNFAESYLTKLRKS